jgi:ribonuclease HII
MLRSKFSKFIEAGVDEAGRGCLAGPVFAAAVILPKGYRNKILNDSKKLSRSQRNELRIEIESNAIAWSVASCTHEEIDTINILRASHLAMHRAIDGLQQKPEFLLIDGNRFHPHPHIPHQCFIKGDATFASIAAASVLAKTHRDAFMMELHEAFPHYHWKDNKAYGTVKHVAAIIEHGYSPFHRKSFHLKVLQMKLDLENQSANFENHQVLANSTN